MQDKLSIINNAFILLRVAPINDIEDKQQHSQAAKVVYDQCRLSLLSMHSWNFAIKQQTLARLQHTPNFRYQYKYQLPEDCITVLRVNENLDYKIQQNTIITNEDRAQLTYVFNHNKPELFSVSFATTLSHYIAYKLSYTMTGTSNSKQIAYQEFEVQLQQARNHDDKQDYQDQIGQQGFSLIDARYQD